MRNDRLFINISGGGSLQVLTAEMRAVTRKNKPRKSNFVHVFSGLSESLMGRRSTYIYTRRGTDSTTNVGWATHAGWDESSPHLTIEEAASQVQIGLHRPGIELMPFHAKRRKVGIQSTTMLRLPEKIKYVTRNDRRSLFRFSR